MQYCSLIFYPITLPQKNYGDAKADGGAKPAMQKPMAVKPFGHRSSSVNLLGGGWHLGSNSASPAPCAMCDSLDMDDGAFDSPPPRRLRSLSLNALPVLEFEEDGEVAPSVLIETHGEVALSGLIDTWGLNEDVPSLDVGVENLEGGDTLGALDGDTSPFMAKLNLALGPDNVANNLALGMEVDKANRSRRGGHRHFSPPTVRGLDIRTPDRRGRSKVDKNLDYLCLAETCRDKLKMCVRPSRAAQLDSLLSPSSVNTPKQMSGACQQPTVVNRFKSSKDIMYSPRTPLPPSATTGFAVGDYYISKLAEMGCQVGEKPPLSSTCKQGTPNGPLYDYQGLLDTVALTLINEYTQPKAAGWHLCNCFGGIEFYINPQLVETVFVNGMGKFRVPFPVQQVEELMQGKFLHKVRLPFHAIASAELVESIDKDTEVERQLGMKKKRARTRERCLLRGRRQLQDGTVLHIQTSVSHPHCKPAESLSRVHVKRTGWIFQERRQQVLMDEGHGKKTVVEIRVTDVTFITVQRVRNIPVSLTPWSCGQTRNVLERVRTRLMRNLVEAHVHYPFMEAEGVAAGLSTSTAPLIFEEEGIDCSECPPLTAIDGSKPLTHFDVFGVESGAIDMTRPIGIEEYHDPDLENASVRSYSPSFTDWCSPQAILNNSNGNSRSRPRGNSAGSETMFADAANAEPVAFDFGSDPLLSVFDELEANDGNAEQEGGHSDSHSQGSSESGLQLDQTGDTINLTRGLELNPDGHRSFVFEENENDAYGWVQIENPSISDVPSTLEAMLDNECYSLLHDAVQGAGANKGKVVPKRREWKLVRRANDISWYRRDFISQVKSSCVEAMASMHMWGSPDAILHCLLEECDEEILPNGLVVKRSVSQVSHEICNATEIKNKLNPWTTVTSEVHLLPGIRRPCKTCLLKAVRKLSDGTIFVVVKSVVDDGGDFRSKKLGRKLQAWKDYNQLTILRQVRMAAVEWSGVVAIQLFAYYLGILA
jgi:hypothetical protein